MKRWVLFWVVLLFLASCSSQEVSREEIILNNQKVEKVLGSLANSETNMKNFEESFKGLLFSIDFMQDEVLYEGFAEGVQGLVEDEMLVSHSVSFVYALESLIQRLKNDEYYGITTNQDIISILEDSLTTYTFLDSDTGVVEQLFVLRLPSKVMSFSVTWYGGEVVESTVIGS